MALLGKNITSDRRNSGQVENGELWIVSYADMMTLLLGFFVIMFSLSQIDERRMVAIGKQLADTFQGKSTQESSDFQISPEGRQVRAFETLVAVFNLGDSIESAIDNIESKIAGSSSFESAREALTDGMGAENATKLQALGITTEQKPDRMEIALPDAVLFLPGTADLTSDAKKSIEVLASNLLKIQGLASVEVSGHTDSAPPSKTSKYPSNWSLSAARAGAVSELLIHYGLDREQMTARGLADLQPLFPEKRADGTWIKENQAKNRRVQITIRKVEHDAR